MSNSRSFRRGLKAIAAATSKSAAAPVDPGWLERRPPWNKGLTLTAAPSVSTTRRMLRRMEALGVVERSAGRSGKPGRSRDLWSLTEEGRQFRDIGRILERAGWEPRP